MKKETILKELNNRLEELVKKYPTRTISSLRKDILIEYKENGIIKDYKNTSYINQSNKSKENILYFGSCAGFDSMYIVKI